jgi:membrane peptidoglycan carboxypeptidase
VLDRSPGEAAVAASARWHRRHRWYVVTGTAVALVAAGAGGAAAYVSGVPVPPVTVPDHATTVYYADGTTPMARLGDRTRYPVDVATLPAHVTAAVLSARDRSFRAGGPLHRPSALAREHARRLLDRPSGEAARIAVVAAKLEDRYGKDRILAEYLNSVPFGRYTDGVEAAAYAYFGRPARSLTVAEAAVLAGQIGSPDDGADDPTKDPGAARLRWDAIRDGLVDPLKVIDAATAARMEYPGTVLPAAGVRRAPADPMAGSAGLIARRVLAELEGLPPLRDRGWAGITTGGYTVVSTVDLPTQRALERLADPTIAGSVPAGEPAHLQAAAVVVEPGTGRIVAYYGGHDGTGHDFAGPDAPASDAPGGHSPGASFAVYPLAAAIGANISVRSWWDARDGQALRGAWPVRNLPTCQPARTDVTMLVDVVRCGLNASLYALTRRVDAVRVLDIARAAGIDEIWDDTAKRHDLRTIESGREVIPQYLNTEIGIGQYRVSVADHANGMATFAARGARARAHLVATVSRDGAEIHRESTEAVPIGLTRAQVDDLTWVLSQNDAGPLVGGRPAATVDGMWRLPPDETEISDAWIAGYTPELAMAVWVGSGDGQPLRHRNNARVTGLTMPAQIFRGLLAAALAGKPVTPFVAPRFTGDPDAGNASPPPGGG